MADLLPDYEVIEQPVFVWRLVITEDFCINFTEKSKIPCAFHRAMQKLFLGFKWEKI